jgi:hypothetical protein
MDPIQKKAFDWACDYKPWQEDMAPQDYARYGFEQGYKRAIREIRAALRKQGLFAEFLDNLAKDGSIE